MLRFKTLKIILASALCTTIAGGLAITAPVLPETVITADAVVAPETYTSGDFDYRMNDDGTVRIYKYHGAGGNISLPEKLDGFTVTQIGENAFTYQTGITGLSFPDSVTKISEGAFDFCTGIQTVTLGKNIRTIEPYAFYGCTAMKKISLPENLKNIGDHAFAACMVLESFVMPDSVTNCGNGVLSGSGVKSISIGKGISEIPEDAFNSCTYLTSAVIPDNITSIEKNAFAHCSALSNVSISKNTKSIKETAFYNCQSLKTVTIPKTVLSISSKAFGFCEPKGKALPGFTVIGNKNSAAQKYASDNKLSFTDIDYVAESSVSLDKSSVTLIKGDSDTLTAEVLPSNASDKAVSWSSSNKNTAAVLNGKITAVAAGTAYITAKTKNGKTASCKVTVIDPEVKATGVSLNKTAVSLGNGDSFTLTASISPANTDNKKITWISSNTKTATVSAGKIKAVGTGTAVITAKTANGKTAVCKVTVKNAPKTITLTKGILTLGVGEKFTIGSSVNDGAACSKRTYRTSNSKIIKMTRTDWVGDFTAIAPGIAYVTVRTYNGKESTCKVTVKPAPSSVKLNKTSLTLKVGQSGSLNAVIPENSGCAQRTFSSSNSAVLKMTKTNWTAAFTALKPGTAYVTVKTYNGKTAKCKITVVK